MILQPKCPDRVRDGLKHVKEPCVVVERSGQGTFVAAKQDYLVKAKH